MSEAVSWPLDCHCVQLRLQPVGPGLSVWLPSTHDGNCRPKLTIEDEDEDEDKDGLEPVSACAGKEALQYRLLEKDAFPIQVSPKSDPARASTKMMLACKPRSEVPPAATSCLGATHTHAL